LVYYALYSTNKNKKGIKMNKNIPKDQVGFIHLQLIALAVVVVAAVGLVGWRVASLHSNNKVDLVTSTSNQTKTSSPTTSTTASKSSLSPTTSTTASTVKASATSSGAKASVTTNTSNPQQTAATVTTQTSNTVSTPASPPSPFVPSGYTDIGTIPAASLYDVKVPPPASEQPDMTIYACINNLGSQTATVQTIGVLSYGVPQAADSAWYADLDLSSSASSDNIVSTKTTTYSYTDNTWQNNGGTAGSVNATSTVTTDEFNPGVVNDFYVWASGSYGDSTWPGINNHPNVTQLATCP
jgi:cytoskeletal protein RodZ